MPLPENEAFNIKFVQLVESFRCLYDQSLPEYNSLEEQDKAWHSIARKVSAGVQDCKLRWKHLRGGLTRYLKKVKEKPNQTEKPVRQFYLYDVMKFVVPHLRSRDSTVHITYAFEPEDEESNDIDCQTIKSEEGSVVDDYEAHAELNHAPITLDISDEHSSDFVLRRGVKSKRRKLENVYDSFETISVNPEKVANDILEKSENSDLQFFRSIVPDMEQMTASQKRRFKIKVLELIEEFSHE